MRGGEAAQWWEGAKAEAGPTMALWLQNWKTTSPVLSAIYWSPLSHPVDFKDQGTTTKKSFCRQVACNLAGILHLSILLTS